MPIRLVHITDPHLTSLAGERLWPLRGKRWSGYLSWRRRRRFVHRREVLDRLVDSMRAENPVQILVTGDLVHVATAAEIEAAAGWLESLGEPGRVMLVPGNHDVYAADAWPAVSSAWAGYLPQPPGIGPLDGYPLCRRLPCGTASVDLIGLSSAVPSPLFMATGRLGAAQRQRLAHLLGASDAFRCVLIHHPPLRGQASWRKGLTDVSALEGVLAENGAELALHGHGHRNVAARGPGRLRVFGTASASSAHAAAPAAYRTFDIDHAGGCWDVHMRLMTVTESGTGMAAEERWQVRTASAT